MATTLTVQKTEQGLLLPHSLFRDWGEIEVIQEGRQIIIRPKTPAPAQERQAVIQALRQDGLLVEMPSDPAISPVSAEERAALARKLSKGRPLSEMVLEERRTGW